MLTFVGNQGNNAYRLCKWLRESGVETVLYCFPNPNERSDPNSVDQDFELATSSWVKELTASDTEEINHIIQTSDVVVTSGASGLQFIEHLRDAKFLTHFSLGSEVTEWPMMQFRPNCDDDSLRLSQQAHAGLQRADQIITGFRPTMKTLARLKLTHKTQICGYPEDVQDNVNRVDPALLAELNARYSKQRRVFLWLSRVNFISKELSNYKGPEKFLNAFERVRAEHGETVIALVGDHGLDVDAFKQLIADKGLSDAVEFVPHLPFWKLLTYLSIENAVVVDELDEQKGELSGMAREALSVGAVCIKTIDSALMQICHGDGCPILHASDEQTCFDHMSEVIEQSDESFALLKQRSRDWAMRSLDYRNKAMRYVELILAAKYLKDVSSDLN